MRRQAKDRNGPVLPEGRWKLISLTLNVEPSLRRRVVPELSEALVPRVNDPRVSPALSRS